MSILKYAVSLILGGLITLLVVEFKYSYSDAFVSPDKKQAVLIESRHRFAAEDTRRLRISLIDTASGKWTARTWFDVQDPFLLQFLKGTDRDPHSYNIEWLMDGAVNVVISDSGDVIQLPSGTHADTGSPEDAESIK